MIHVCMPTTCTLSLIVVVSVFLQWSPDGCCDGHMYVCQLPCTLSLIVDVSVFPQWSPDGTSRCCWSWYSHSSSTNNSITTSTPTTTLHCPQSPHVWWLWRLQQHVRQRLWQPLQPRQPLQPLWQHGRLWLLQLQPLRHAGRLCWQHLCTRGRRELPPGVPVDREHRPGGQLRFHDAGLIFPSCVQFFQSGHRRGRQLLSPSFSDGSGFLSVGADTDAALPGATPAGAAEVATSGAGGAGVEGGHGAGRGGSTC